MHSSNMVIISSDKMIVIGLITSNKRQDGLQEVNNFRVNKLSMGDENLEDENCEGGIEERERIHAVN